MSTREEILAQLRNVQNQIKNIMSVREQQINIIAQFRQKESEITFSDAEQMKKLIVIIGYLAVLGFYIIRGLISFRWTDTIIFALLGGYCFLYKPDKKSKLKTTAWALLLIFMIYVLVSMILRFDIAMIIIFIIEIIVGLYIIKRLNAKIAEKNAAIESYNQGVLSEYNVTVQQINKMQTELAKIIDGWYPPSYCYFEAVDFFISAITNYKADNIKEAVNLFDTAEHRQRMENCQQQLVQGQRMLIASQNQIIEGQKVLIQQQKFTNMLQIQNMMLQIENQRATESAIRSATSDIETTLWRMHNK